MIFAAICLLMLVAAVAAVAIPLWRGTKESATQPDPAAATHALQLAELQRDLATGLLAEPDYQAALRDLEVERARPASVPSRASGRRRQAALLAAVFVTVAAALLYDYYGSWRSGALGVEQASVPAVEQMVADLSAKLHSTGGDDLQGWEMLGHAYVIMQRYPDAVDAYGHAYKLAGDSQPDVLSGYAEALTLANPADFMDKALPLFEKTLQIDPKNAQALWYGGLGAYERGDKPLAVQRWQALLAQDPPAQYRAVISKYIVQAGGSVDVAPAVAAGSDTVLRLHVTMAPALRRQVRPDETLFVFVLPEGAAGGPPLAVRRFQAGALPLDVALSDQDAPIPGQSISGHAQLHVVARISRRGTPEEQPGDFVGQGEWSRASAGTLAIVIDTPIR
ncbi:MAG TPA: c-type cytochrome biogenesis protein CcmI [Gammaproteobacteria bacterium]|nr:c-type cytochrome biogenesis protein CcmI [Gammaproteobacteria bacterium]